MQCLVLAFAMQGWGQDQPTEPKRDDGDQPSPGEASEEPVILEHQDVLREGQVLRPSDDLADDDFLPTSPQLARPERPERPDLPPTVAAQVERFRDYSRLYLIRQQNLKKRMMGANDRERAALRRQLAEARNEFNDLLRQRRHELRDRAASLREKLPNHKEVIDSIREDARDSARSALEESRTRRGTD
jgi:hypothetical protein